MNNNSTLLVCIINNAGDLQIAKDLHWYRIPIDKADKLLKKHWPPRWIAFYHSGAIKEQPHMIKYYAKVSKIVKATRQELFPYEKKNYKSSRQYYKIVIDKLFTLHKPILSRRWRRIVFIQTTYNKFKNAIEINDLYSGSKLEDILWAECKRNKIAVERQERVIVDGKYYFLDFAVHCKNGKLDIETDGDKWHHNAKGAEKDNLRNNELESSGWKIIRFNSYQIREKIEDYCIPTIKTNINHLGGIDFEKVLMKRFLDYNPDSSYLRFFEEYE